jgi:hypothetical protein
MQLILLQYLIIYSNSSSSIFNSHIQILLSNSLIQHITCNSLNTEETSMVDKAIHLQVATSMAEASHLEVATRMVEAIHLEVATSMAEAMHVEVATIMVEGSNLEGQPEWSRLSINRRQPS